MKFGFAMQHRSFPNRGRRRRMRSGCEQYDEWSVATADAMKNKSW